MQRSESCQTLCHQQLPEYYATHAEISEEPLGWLPATHAAIALRLLSLDAALRYESAQPPWRETQPAFRFVQIPALTQDTSKVHAVCGPLLAAPETFMPMLPQALLPPDPVEFAPDVEALRQLEDDAHLREQVPSGAD